MLERGEEREGEGGREKEGGRDEVTQVGGGRGRRKAKTRQFKKMSFILH